MTLGHFAPQPGVTCPGVGARRPTMSHVANHSSQAYEVESKKVAPVLSCKVSKERPHV